MMHKVTLEQWRMLKAVVDHGGFAQAGEAIHKSASTINHAVHKLQDALGVQILEVRGRRAFLTLAGEALLRRAGQLLEEAQAIEDVAAYLAEGTEAQVRLAVDQIFPQAALASALAHFSAAYPQVRVQLHEPVLSGGAELLYEGVVDLLITASSVQGFLGDPLLSTRFICVAHPDHPLHQSERPLSLRDLRHHRQLVVRDSARSSTLDAGWLKAEQRWTVGHLSTSVGMLIRGLGFAWVPEHLVTTALASGQLKQVPLTAGGTRHTVVQLIHADQDREGAATQFLADQLRLASQVYDADHQSDLDHPELS